MSIWYDIENKEDIDLSEDHTEVHVLYKADKTGNHYISIPTEFLHELLGSGQVRVDEQVRKVFSKKG